mmetsp:Transcript_105644/g.251906  ORF Transcript_105644/g.251906 Transcript_105644/m.251906 type:complete len:316 (+) Transcript_105644:2362-3309(+)
MPLATSPARAPAAKPTRWSTRNAKTCLWSVAPACPRTVSLVIGRSGRNRPHVTACARGSARSRGCRTTAGRRAMATWRRPSRASLRSVLASRTASSRTGRPGRDAATPAASRRGCERSPPRTGLLVSPATELRSRHSPVRSRSTCATAGSLTGASGVSAPSLAAGGRWRCPVRSWSTRCTAARPVLGPPSSPSLATWRCAAWVPTPTTAFWATGRSGVAATRVRRPSAPGARCGRPRRAARHAAAPPRKQESVLRRRPGTVPSPTGATGAPAAPPVAAASASAPERSRTRRSRGASLARATPTRRRPATRRCRAM